MVVGGKCTANNYQQQVHGGERGGLHPEIYSKKHTHKVVVWIHLNGAKIAALWVAVVGSNSMATIFTSVGRGRTSLMQIMYSKPLILSRCGGGPTQ